MPAKPISNLSPRREADEKIRCFEGQYDLLRHQFDGWCIWPLIRFAAAYQIGSQALFGPTSSFPGYQQALFTVNDLFKLPFIHPADYAVFVQSSNRNEMQQGRYKDLYFDDLLAELGHFIKIENKVNPQFIARNRQALIKSDISASYIQFLTKFLAKLGVPAETDALGAALEADLRQGLGLTLFRPGGMSVHLRRFYWSKRLYRQLLHRIRPRYLLLITAYFNYPIVAAAKELGITVVEFQHGVIDRYHSGYSWSAYAQPYKAKMPVPDRLFLYGRFWRDELTANGFWDTELRPVGSLRMDQYCQAQIERPSDEKLFVVTTQNIDTDRLIAFLKDFVTLARGRLAFRLVIKLHPGEFDKEKYLSAFQTVNEVRSVNELRSLPQVTVLLSSEGASTFDLLKQAHYHLSIYSTCHYEALRLGTPTVILPFTNHDAVIHLLESGYATLAATPQTLLDIALRPDVVVPPEIGAYYFSAQALENMRKELE